MSLEGVPRVMKQTVGDLRTRKEWGGNLMFSFIIQMETKYVVMVMKRMLLRQENKK